MSKSYLQIYVFILPLKFFTIPQCRGLAPFPLQGHDTGPAPCMPPSPSSWLWPDGAASVQHMVVLAIFMGYVTHRDTIQIPFMKLKLLEISIIIPFYSHFSLVDLGWSKKHGGFSWPIPEGVHQWNYGLKHWSLDVWWTWTFDGISMGSNIIDIHETSITAIPWPPRFTIWEIRRGLPTTVVENGVPRNPSVSF